MEWPDKKQRCTWANPKNELYIRYHDEEWGVPVYDDHRLFEMLVLESFQAGLSWECVLNKRGAFREAFDDFDLEKVCAYTEDKLLELQQNLTWPVVTVITLSNLFLINTALEQMDFWTQSLYNLYISSN